MVMPKKSLKSIADRDAAIIENERLKVSFEYICWDNKEFFFHGLDEKDYQKYFACFNEITKYKEKDIQQQTAPSLTPKSIFDTETSTYSCFPASIKNKIATKLRVETKDESEALKSAEGILKRAFELRVGKNYGRVHGFLWNNIFYVIWLDPAHNLYPMQRGITEPSEFCKIRSVSIDSLHELRSLVECQSKKIIELESDLDEITKPS